MNQYDAITTLWPQFALELALEPQSAFQHSALASPHAYARNQCPISQIGTYDSDESYFTQLFAAENEHSALLQAANVSGGWRVDVLSQLEKSALDLVATGTLCGPQIQNLFGMQQTFAPLQEIEPWSAQASDYLPTAQQIILAYFSPN